MLLSARFPIICQSSDLHIFISWTDPNAEKTIYSSNNTNLTFKIPELFLSVYCFFFQMKNIVSYNFSHFYYSVHAMHTMYICIDSLKYDTIFQYLLRCIIL